MDQSEYINRRGLEALDAPSVCRFSTLRGGWWGGEVPGTWAPTRVERTCMSTPTPRKAQEGRSVSLRLCCFQYCGYCTSATMPWPWGLPVSPGAVSYPVHN